jgi:outer membrane protein
MSLRFFLVSLVSAQLVWAAEPTPPPKPTLAHPIPSLQEDRPGQGAALVLTLEESVERALHEATSVQRAQGDLDISGDQLLQSYAEFLPNLTASGTSNTMTGKNYLTTATPTMVDTRNHGMAYQISSTINVFNGFADLGSWRASGARKEAAGLSLKRAKQLIALDVAQSFLQVILDQQIIRIAEKNLISSQAREALLTEQTRVGVRNLADLFRQQAQTSSDETYLVTAQSKERADELGLLRKLRLDATLNYRLVSPELKERATEEFTDEDKLVKTALSERADLAASEDVARAAGWDVTASRALYYPRLDFGAVVGSTSRILDRQLVTTGGTTTNVVPANQMDIGDQLTHQVNYTIGFTLTWTIWDRWITETNVQKARVTAHNASLDADDRRLQVVGEIRQAFGDYRAVLQQLESTKKGLVAAEKAYEVVQGRYQVGSSTFIDLSTAQATEVQAAAARAQALIAYALQRRALETALGTASY